ncbi:MAG TPA: heme exporter protein CcmB [Rhizomicrobium sp.]|jgi:heme exporter protein B|nr:heme exporter protein CcmB [Rhizomicrobium sp.]
MSASIFLRDLRLAFRAGGSAMLALAFFASVITLVPLGVGPDLRLLAKIAGGILWIAAVLAALLALDRLFQADYDDGSLDLIALGPASLESVAAAKIAAHWATTGLPLTILSPLLAVLFGLPAEAIPALCASLAIGTPAVSALGAIGAALTVSIRRGGLILPLLVLPLLAPVVIFGAGAVEGSGAGALLFLSAFSLGAVLLSPFAVAAAVRLNLAG